MSVQSGRCSRGSVSVRCGCRDESGRQLGAGCPRLGRAGHGSWSFEVRIPTPAGRVRVRRGGYATAAEARQELTAFRRRSGDARVAGSWTTGRWLTYWLQTHRAIRASTHRSYESHLRLYLMPALGRIPLDELSSLDVQAMIDAVIRSHAQAGTPICPAT